VASENKYKFRDDDMAARLDGLLEALCGEKTVLPSEAAARKKASEKRTKDQRGDNDEGAGIGAENARKAERIQGTSCFGRATSRGAAKK